MCPHTSPCVLALHSGLLRAASILRRAGSSGNVRQHTILYLSGTDSVVNCTTSHGVSPSPQRVVSSRKTTAAPGSLTLYPEKMERELCQGYNVESDMKEQARLRPQREEHRVLPGTPEATIGPRKENVNFARQVVPWRKSSSESQPWLNAHIRKPTRTSDL